MPVSSTITVSARIGGMILAVAETRGVDRASLARRAGFDPKLLGDPDARMPIAIEDALWEGAAELSGDEAFGLYAASLLRPGMLDVLDYVVRSQPTVRGALEALARYNRLAHDVAVFELRELGEELEVVHRFRGVAREPCRHAAEFTLSSLLVVGSQLAGRPLRASGARFTHGPPRDQRAHEAAFGHRPRFAASDRGLRLSAADLALPVVGVDAQLGAVLARHAELLLSKLPEPSEAASSRLRRALVPLLEAGEPTLAAAAAKLEASGRTLQRQLAREGTSFDRVLDELRRDLARSYLADPAIAITEVAFLLGFAEASTFHRAFRRWTKQTPGAYRRALSAGASG